jgi:hypothetical protein
LRLLNKAPALKKRVAEHLADATSRMTIVLEQLPLGTMNCSMSLRAGEPVAAHDASSVLSTDAVRSNN